mmetsp:Transcript_18877/g.46349  ORF Transcript_18877/g.46349 Transcript_18877/m.46349 type:complete len:274 (-) Transcript_18877:122-943(-)
MAKASLVFFALVCLLPCARGFLVPSPALSLRAGLSKNALPCVSARVGGAPLVRMSGDGKGELSAEEKKRLVLRQALEKDKAAQEKKRKIFEEATRAQAAAEEAAERAAALKGRGFFSESSASEASASVEESLDASLGEDEDSGPAGLPKRKYSRTFFNVSLTKPMGMILEDNDPTVGGVYVAQFTPNSPAEQCEELKLGAQLVSVAGKSVKGLHFEGVMDALKQADSPVPLEFFDGSVSSLYGGWGEQARGREVTVDTNRPNKKLIDRIRSGL